MRVAGVMSGTSLDGIDVAIVDFTGRRREVVGFRSRPYAPDVRERILAVSNRTAHTGAVSALNFELGGLYADAIVSACRSARVKVGTLDLVGCHGQTIYHASGAHTLQIGEAAVIAERLRVPVVSDFRPRDIAAGGKGAPLVPLVDYLLFRHPSRTRVAVNIGGIANVTIIPAGAKPGDVVAFDTGPGNMVIDALVKEYTRGRKLYDRGGRIAARGQADARLVARLMRDPYYAAPPPKTAGREQYGREFVRRLRRTGHTLVDLIATATMLTAAAISRAIPGAPDVIVSGGGAHNRTLMGELEDGFPGSLVTTSAACGVDPDAKEAIAFAILARETWQGRPGNLPSATGARRPVVLGKITRA